MGDYSAFYTYPPKPAGWSSVRRVVNGHDLTGKSVVVSDAACKVKSEPCPGVDGAAIWTTGETPTMDNSRPAEYDGALEPIPGMGLVRSNGSNCRFTDLAPGASIVWHRTTSLDYNIIISGTLLSLTEDGKETLLEAGDVIVQRGCMHSWKNPGPDWVRWVSVVIDAQPAVVNGKSLDDAWEF